MWMWIRPAQAPLPALATAARCNSELASLFSSYLRFRGEYTSTLNSGSRILRRLDLSFGRAGARRSAVRRIAARKTRPAGTLNCATDSHLRTAVEDRAVAA